MCREMSLSPCADCANNISESHLVFRCSPPPGICDRGKTNVSVKEANKHITRVYFATSNAIFIYCATKAA